MSKPILPGGALDKVQIHTTEGSDWFGMDWADRLYPPKPYQTIPNHSEQAFTIKARGFRECTF